MADPKNAPKPTVAPEGGNPNPAANGAAGASEARPQVAADIAAKAAEMAGSVAAQVSGPGAQGRAILLPNGMRRVDYIKARWAAGAGRGQIVKELKALGQEGISYQIVFAATKDTKPASSGATGASAPTQAAASTEQKPAE